MTEIDFISFLDGRREQARAHFMACKQELEAYERTWGPDFTFIEPWKSQTLLLSRKAKAAYDAYEKAWVEWFAKLNGYALPGPDPHKSTEAMATPFPVHEAVARIEAQAKELARKAREAVVNSA